MAVLKLFDMEVVTETKHEKLAWRCQFSQTTNHLLNFQQLLVIFSVQQI